VFAQTLFISLIFCPLKASCFPDTQVKNENEGVLILAFASLSNSKEIAVSFRISPCN
jgi:hypothetical protein